MIIHAPEVTQGCGEVCASARVQFQTDRTNLPDCLWFRFPQQCEDFVAERTDGFVTSLLPLAMALGEDVKVRGVVSPRLAFGLDEYQRILCLWFPWLYRKVTLTYENLEPIDSTLVHGKVLAAFSGGVDSFYTLWSHLDENERHKGFQINYVLFVHGFDIPLEDAETFRFCAEAYGPVIRGLGVEFLTVRTNVRHFFSHLNWSYCHGAPLSALPLVLARLATRFYVPATYSHEDSPPWGSDARLDTWPGTETLESFHDGGATSRMGKLAVIAKWPVTYNLLRVCWENPAGVTNCCRCSKCLRTMLALDVLDALDRYATFPTPLDRRAVRRLRMKSRGEYPFARSILNYALANSRRDVALDMGYVILKSEMIDRLKPIRGAITARFKHGPQDRG